MGKKPKSGKKKILVVDDDPIDLIYARRILGDKHTIIEASDGEQAVTLARKHKPDIILMDMMMPGKDGITACLEIRADAAMKDIPVIMLTGVKKELNEKLTTSLGLNLYITKPFKPRELLDAISRF